MQSSASLKVLRIAKKVASKLGKHMKRNNLENSRFLGYDIVLTDE
jgi:hypothetical protein